MASVSGSRSTPIGHVARRTAIWLTLLIAGWWLVAPLYGEAIFGASSAALRLDPTTDVAIGQDGSGVPTVYRGHQESTQPVFRFDRVGLFYNTIVLLALMLAVPGWHWRRRVFRLGLGLGLLALTHVGFVVLQTKAQFINLGLTQASEGMAYLVNWLAVLVGPIGEGLFPLAIAFGLSWRTWADAYGLRIGRGQPSGNVGRNDPCPCGSGRKHKRCCG